MGGFAGSSGATLAFLLQICKQQLLKGEEDKMLSLMFENEKMVYQCRCYYSVQDFILGALLTLITPFERVILESKTLRNLE